MKFSRIAIVLFLVFVLMLFTFTILVNKLVGDAKTTIEDSQKPYTEMINKRVVVDKDTLTVVDYSAIKDVVILSNGKEVALKYAQLNTIK